MATANRGLKGESKVRGSGLGFNLGFGPWVLCVPSMPCGFGGFVPADSPLSRLGLHYYGLGVIYCKYLFNAYIYMYMNSIPNSDHIIVVAASSSG